MRDNEEIDIHEPKQRQEIDFPLAALRKNQLLVYLVFTLVVSRTLREFPVVKDLWEFPLWLIGNEPNWYP